MSIISTVNSLQGQVDDSQKQAESHAQKSTEITDKLKTLSADIGNNILKSKAIENANLNAFKSEKNNTSQFLDAILK